MSVVGEAGGWAMEACEWEVEACEWAVEACEWEVEAQWWIDLGTSLGIARWTSRRLMTRFTTFKA